MRILKQGKLEDYKFTCNKCECVFIADERDKKEIRVTAFIARDVVYCPFCEKEIEWGEGIFYNNDKTH